MKIIRTIRRHARRSGVATLLASLLLLVGCSSWSTPDGEILEVEQGENGVKIEYYDADLDAAGRSEDENREVYLKSGNSCVLRERIQDCAEPEDVLMPAEQAADHADTPPGMFRDCRQAKAINVAPITTSTNGWNPKLDPDGNGVACQ